MAERLADTYRPMLEAGEVRMVVNRAPVAPSPWGVEDRHEFVVRAAGRLVRGWWGLLPEVPLPGAPEAGIRLYHLGRLVGAPEWFGHPTPAAHPALNRLVGEVELPHVPVTMNKADIDRGSETWAAVEARLHAVLAPVVRRLTREPASAVTPEAARTAEQVRRILAKALRLLEEGRLFESEVAVGGDEPGGQLALEGVRKPAQMPAEGGDEEAGVDPGASGATEPTPRLPRSGAAGGPGTTRRRGSAEVVVRRLDPRLRSALVEEDGVRKVVINSAYPLYEVRRGDLWYQLETALREVCVTIPEATVPEFERRVNELMLVSLALAERREGLQEGRRGGDCGPGASDRPLALSSDRVLASTHAVAHCVAHRDPAMPLVRTNLTLPAETLAIIDEVAGPRGRSAYIAEVLLKQAKRDRMKRVWEENRGALKDSEAWGRTPGETLRILREVRASWDRPSPELPALERES